jgi:hypothetical protein
MTKRQLEIVATLANYMLDSGCIQDCLEELNSDIEYSPVTSDEVLELYRTANAGMATT